jgi:hypothetical protein
MQAGIRNVLAYHNSNSLDPIITSITSKAPGLRLPTLMSSAALLVESLGKARSSCNDGLVLLPRIFSTVPQLAGAARFRLLLELQPLSELYRYLVGLQELSASQRIISAKGADGVLAGFASHISEWQNKRFAVSHVAGSKAELAHVDTVLSVRTLVAGHMKKALTIVQGGSSLPAFIKYFNAALRTSYASAFTAAVDAGEQALAKLRMTSCHNVNFERDQPLSAAQRALALQLGRASVAKLGASTATEASVKRMDGLLVQNVRIARHAADELGKDDFIEHLMNSNVDILEQAPLVGTSAEVMSDICISQYALDHQFLLATAARDLFLHRLSFNTPAPPGDTTLLDSLTAFQAACDGSICFPVARCGDTSIALKHPTAVGVISPGRSLLYQQSAANYEFAIFLDEILRKLQDASKASSSILETAICSGGCKTAEDMAAKFVRAVLMCLATCSGSTTIDASARLNVDLGSFDPLVSVGEPTSVAIRTRQRNASLLLPRVLSLCRSNTHALEELTFGMRLRVGLTKVGASSPRPMPVVPVYSFLPWISQVLASITETMSSDAAESKNYRKHLVNLMMEIGAQYPQAVYYPLRISSATLPGDPMSNSAESTATWAEISKMVGSTVLDAFVRAMEDLHNPEMKFLDWSKAVRVDLQSHCNVVGSTNASLPSESAARWYQDLMSRCFDEGKLVKPGSYVSKWRSTWRDQVTKALQGGKVINAASLAAAEKPAGGDSPTQPPKNNKLASMSQLSMWLSQFSATSDSFIEIPGQYSKYDGSSAPIVAHHAKLIAVDESIRTMSSIRQPKRIVLHGDNQRSYIFLAKGGEDIRVDQRVQQLFNMANVFIERTMRNSSKLLRTYAVVPMTPYIGLIEWVPNTLPIKMAVEDVANIRMERIASELPTAGKRAARAVNAPAWTVGENEAANIRALWLQKYARSSNHPQAVYKLMNATATPDEVVEMWNSQMKVMPLDLLREVITARALSADGYYALRSNFINSLMSFNCVGYIAGIGDRHLDNWLLDTETCSIVPIDFGAAFGVATTGLPVPELIPFRLSPQFIGVIQPLPVISVLEKGMGATLRALQGTDAVRALMAIMEVFILEPTLDWQISAQRKSTISKEASLGSPPSAAPIRIDSDVTVDDSSGESHAQDLAKLRVLIARLKLQRIDPATLMQIELLQNTAYGLTNRRTAKEPDLDPLRRVKDALAGTDRNVGRRLQPALTEDWVPAEPDQLLLESGIGGPLINNASRKFSKAYDVRLKRCKDAEAQAACLIDLASDPNIAGRQWAGLALWV